MISIEANENKSLGLLIATILWLLFKTSVIASSIGEEDIVKDQNEFEWLNFVKDTTALQTSWIFEAKDQRNRAIDIEGKISHILSQDLLAFKQSIADIAAKTLAPDEVMFLKAFPEAVSQEMFLKPCMPLFENGLNSVNWNSVEETIESTINQFYLADVSKFGAEIIEPLLKDIYLFLKIKDKETNAIIGFLISAITPALPYGNIKLINMVVVSEERNKGVEELALSSIFQIIPKISKIFCFVRPTNAYSLATYQNLGFTKDLQPFDDPNHKVNMEHLIRLQYDATQLNILQKIDKKTVCSGLLNL